MATDPIRRFSGPPGSKVTAFIIPDIYTGIYTKALHYAVQIQNNSMIRHSQIMDEGSLNFHIVQVNG